MRDVQARFANLLRQIHVAVDDGGFGGASIGAQAETKTGWPGVHRAILGHPRVFGVLYDREIQLRAEAQGHAHDVVVEDGLAVVGNRDRACALQSAKSVSVPPRLPRVAAAMGNTLTTAPRSGCRCHATHSGESTTGAVLGMVQTEVKPPAAAAAVPVTMVSL
jgi:hypothetical protein